MVKERSEGLEPRKAAVLSAIVREYVLHGEPVGSRYLVETYGLDVSAATVRNDMAALEDAGYIVQPHTSAGRVPTDEGYRYFVDALSELQPIGEQQRLAIQGFLAEARDLEDLLRRTTGLLADLTRYASLVLAPALDRSRLKVVELVGLGPYTVLLLLIADTGRVEKRLIELTAPVSDDDLQRTRTILNETTSGLRLADVPSALDGLLAAAPGELQELLQRVATGLSTDLVRSTVDQVFVAGQAALAGQGTFEVTDLHRVFELLEEQATLGRVLAESASLDRPMVRIGHENVELPGLTSASIVATAYGQDAPGSLGVLGPTRMNYPAVLGAVQAVADQLQSALRALTHSAAASEEPEDDGPTAAGAARGG